MSNQHRSSNLTDPRRRGFSGYERPRNLKSQRGRRRRSSAGDALRNRDIKEAEVEEVIVLTPWEAFQEHLRLIDDNTAMYTVRDPHYDKERDTDNKGQANGTEENKAPELTVEQKASELTKQLPSTIKVKNSDAFSKTMHELQLRKQQHVERLAAIQRERERRAEAEQAEGKEQEVVEVTFEEEEAFDSDWSDEDDVDVVDTAAVHLRQTATRAWGIIRRHIQEITMLNKHKSSAMNWNFLRQTISHMTDMEKGRQNLYERYLYKPDGWKDGFTNFPSELFNRERGRGRRAYVPPPSAKPKPKRKDQNSSSNNKSNGNMISVNGH